MASIKKNGKRWRVQLMSGKQRESATFDTKAEAILWANEREAGLRGKTPPTKTLDDALERYAREKAPSLGGADWAKKKIKNLRADPVSGLRLGVLTGTTLAEWRDARGGIIPSTRTPVKAATVNRELNLLHSVLKAAVEWGWLTTNPLKGVERPKSPPSRKRRVSQAEIEAVSLALGYKGGAPANLSQRVALAFQFAIETAMRGGEIVRLQWEHVSDKSVYLPKTKNGEARSVPLSKRAREILSLLLPKIGAGALQSTLKPVALSGDDAYVFALRDSQRDALFRKGRDKAGVNDLHFHDSRAEAIWRMSKKLDVLELARVIGHRNLASLMMYYNASADELADKLD